MKLLRQNARCRIARWNVALLSLILLGAWAPGVSHANSRPASAGEIANMQSVIGRFPDMEAAESITMADPRVDESSGLAAANLSGHVGGQSTWESVGVFGVGRDTVASTGALSMYPWILLPVPTTCFDTQTAPIADLDAESLRLVPDRSCSRGRRSTLRPSQLRRLARRRARANAGIAKLNRAFDDCDHAASQRASARCGKRAMRRYYGPPVNRLLGTLAGLEHKLSFDDCQNSLDLFEGAVERHKASLTEMLNAILHGDDQAAGDARSEIGKASRSSRRHWGDVRILCK